MKRGTSNYPLLKEKSEPALQGAHLCLAGEETDIYLKWSAQCFSSYTYMRGNQDVVASESCQGCDV